MFRLLKSIFLISFLLFFCSTFVLAEDITITTYYPSPYGSYRELRAQRMGIGTTYYDRATVCWDPPCPVGSVNVSAANPSLLVEGNVGIGTMTPGFGNSYVGLHVYKISGNTVAARVQYVGMNPIDVFSNSTNAAGLRHWGGPLEFRTSGENVRMSILDNGYVGIGTQSPLSKLSINGGLHVGGDSQAGDNNLLVDGNISAIGTVCATSSRKKKTNIQPLSKQDYQGILKKVEEIEVVHFNFKDQNISGAKRNIGVIAEDSPDEITNLQKDAIDMSGYLGFLLAAVKAQNEQISILKKQVAVLMKSSLIKK